MQIIIVPTRFLHHYDVFIKRIFYKKKIAKTNMQLNGDVKILFSSSKYIIYSNLIASLTRLKDLEIKNEPEGN